MKLNIDCREATRLVLEGQDRNLSLGDRVRLRAHLVVCRACPVFVRQARLMREAMGRWKRYSDDG